jgi:hypothetical protein
MHARSSTATITSRRVDVGRADPYAKRAVLAGGSGGLRLSSVLPVTERADEPACLGAVEHDGRGLVVPEGAEPDERGLSGGAYMWAVLVGVDDERRAEFHGERSSRAPG